MTWVLFWVVFLGYLAMIHITTITLTRITITAIATIHKSNTFAMGSAMPKAVAPAMAMGMPWAMAVAMRLHPGLQQGALRGTQE